MVIYDEFYRGHREHDSQDNKGRPECNVYASATSADNGSVSAYCNYDFTEIHYHIHFPENMDKDSLIEVLKFMQADKALPHGNITTTGEEDGKTVLDDGTVIEKRTFWERLVHHGGDNKRNGS